MVVRSSASPRPNRFVQLPPSSMVTRSKTRQENKSYSIAKNQNVTRNLPSIINLLQDHFPPSVPNFAPDINPGNFVYTVDDNREYDYSYERKRQLKLGNVILPHIDDIFIQENLSQVCVENFNSLDHTGNRYFRGFITAQERDDYLTHYKFEKGLYDPISITPGNDPIDSIVRFNLGYNRMLNYRNNEYIFGVYYISPTSKIFPL